MKFLDFSNLSIFESRSGFSSIWWAKRCKNIVSIEHNEDWYLKIKTLIKEFTNIEIFLLKEHSEYISFLNKLNSYFDIYIIDGIQRGEMAKSVVSNILKFGGQIIIVDNSDWYPNILEFIFFKLNWIRVDFHGFGPINDYTWTTTLFFNRNCDYRIFKQNEIFSEKSIKQIAKDDYKE